MQVFAAQLEEAVAPPAIPAWEEIAQALTTRVEEAIRGSGPSLRRPSFWIRTSVGSLLGTDFWWAETRGRGNP